MKRVLLIAAVLAFLTVACADVHVADERWPNGMWVRPHFVMPPLPADDGLKQATCLLGMSDLAEATIETWNEDPNMIHVEEWSWWFWSDFIHGIPDRNECIDAWPANEPLIHHDYSCGAALIPYWGAGSQQDMLFFRLHFLCDANGYAYWPCGPDCGLGLFGAVTENTPLTEAQQAMAYFGGNLDPTGQYIVDPSDPYPVTPRACHLDPRDLRVCIEDEPPWAQPPASS